MMAVKDSKHETIWEDALQAAQYVGNSSRVQLQVFKRGVRAQPGRPGPWAPRRSQFRASSVATSLLHLPELPDPVRMHDKTKYATARDTKSKHLTLP